MATLTVGGCTADELAKLVTAVGADVANSLCEKLGGSIPGMSLKDSTAELTVGVNVMFLLFAGALVFIMHAGFAMLCAGAIRSKNTMNILLQTVLDAASSAVAFYVLGRARRRQRRGGCPPPPPLPHNAARPRRREPARAVRAAPRRRPTAG